MKTPMSVINEFCTRHNAIPKYKLVVNANKEYTCNLSFSYSAFNEIVTIGKGRSKRGAKHSAAYEALKLILLEAGADEKDYIEIESIRSPCDGETDENYVKKLKAICESNLLPVPDYVTICTEGVQYKTYIMQCRVSALTTEVKSFSKKHAKQHAAEHMIRKLLCLRKLNLIVPIDDYDSIENSDKENCNTTSKFSLKTLSKYSKVNISDYYRISEMEEEVFLLNYAVCQEFERLADTPVDATDNPKSIVYDISKTSEVPFVFFRIDRIRSKAKKRGNVYVALKSMTPPPWIMLGEGVNESEAQQDASRKMLKFLQVMVASRPVIQQFQPL